MDFEMSPCSLAKGVMSSSTSTSPSRPTVPRPPPLSIAPKSGTTTVNDNPVKPRRRKSKSPQKTLAPPSPRIDLSDRQRDFYGLGTLLFYGSLIGGTSLCLLVFYPGTFYYASLLALFAPVLCFFTFWNWLGLKYFRQNA